MEVRTGLVYREIHDRKDSTVIKYYDTFEEAVQGAERMLEQFKYWGGGGFPLHAFSDKRSAQGKYKGTIDRKDYNYADYAQYARENGNNYGYYRDMKKREEVQYEK